MYKENLQNCSCNQFHNIGTYKQVETNSMTKNRGGNNGSEKCIGKALRLRYTSYDKDTRILPTTGSEQER